MPAGGTLVDAFRQNAHLGDTLGYFLPEQHAAAARLGALADHDFDGVSLAQVVRIHAVARGQDLIDQDAGMVPLFRGHAAVAGRGRGADGAGTAAKRFFGLRRQRAEAHARNGDRNFQLDRILSEAGADGDVGCALLAIAFQRIAADGSAEKQQVVEMRQLALGAAAANVVDAGGGGAANFGDRGVVERCRFARRRWIQRSPRRHQYCPTFSTWKW